MKFKISPEVVRMIAMITAFVQTVGATLALAAPGTVSATLILVIVAIGGGLQAALASYSQGTQTNPPAGMLTEERAAELTDPDPDTEPTPPRFIPGGPVYPQ